MTYNIVPPQHVKSELYDPVDPTLINAGTQLIYNGGPLLANVKVFNVYYGNNFDAELATLLSQFMTYIVTSPLIDQLAEYNTPDIEIGHGSFLGAYSVATDIKGVSISDIDVRHLLGLLTQQGTIPMPDDNTLYFVFLPPGLPVVQTSGDASCAVFCGYHDVYGTNTYYAVMPYPDCSGCTGSLTAFNALTATTTHELCEAITDPIPGSGWYDNANGEIGDICAWQSGGLSVYDVQLEWSNAANACVLPATPGPTPTSFPATPVSPN